MKTKIKCPRCGSLIEYEEGDVEEMQIIDRERKMVYFNHVNEDGEIEEEDCFLIEKDFLNRQKDSDFNVRNVRRRKIVEKHTICELCDGYIYLYEE